MFYTLIEMFVYNLMFPFHKIWDITYFFIVVKNLTCGGGLRVISRLAPAPVRECTPAGVLQNSYR